MIAKVTTTIQASRSHQEQAQQMTLPVTIQIAIETGGSVEIFIISATEAGNSVSRMEVRSAGPG